MRKFLIGSVAAHAIIIALLAPTQAQTIVTSRVGGWQSFEGLTYAGESVCGIGSYGPQVAVQLRIFERNGEFTIHNTQWNIPGGYQTPITVTIGQSRWDWNARAADPTTMVLQVPTSDYESLIVALRDGSMMNWYWNDGGRGWAPLIGTTAVMIRASDCIRRRFPSVAPVAPATPVAPASPRAPGVGVSL